jgi:hypothetical protein
MPVGLSPAVAPTIKSKSVAISASYPNLSTFSFPIKAARGRRCLPERLSAQAQRWGDVKNVMRLPKQVVRIANAVAKLALLVDIPGLHTPEKTRSSSKPSGRHKAERSTSGSLEAVGFRPLRAVPLWIPARHYFSWVMTVALDSRGALAPVYAAFFAIQSLAF